MTKRRKVLDGLWKNCEVGQQGVLVVSTMLSNNFKNYGFENTVGEEREGHRADVTSLISHYYCVLVYTP